MKTENTNKQERLSFFKELYASALMARSEELSALERCMRQYKGTDEIDGSTERALTVRNITYEIVESQVSSDIPMPKADPASYSEKRGRNAESIERLCRSIRDKLPFEEMNDLDERYTYVYGGSVFYVEWDNDARTSSEVGAVRIYCLSPKDFIGQPGIFNIEDMEYCFLRFTTTRSEISRKYSVSEGMLGEVETDYEFSSPSDDGNTVSLTVCFYRDEDGDVSRYIFSGGLCLSDQPKYYMRKRSVCSLCGSSDPDCGCKGAKREEIGVTHERLLDSLLSSDAPEGIDGGAKIPYYLPKDFPIVIRKNTSGENSLFGQSDCDYIRPEQQAINKIESRILQKLLRAGITPIVPEDASVSLNNSVFGQVIKMKPGESAQQYGKVDTTPDISQDVLEAERLYDHAKRTIGISDAFQGIDTGNANESGYAKQLRISQATGRLESKRKMKYTAYANLDRIIFRLYLAFADEPRKLAYKDSYGRVHEAEFNRYDFIEYDVLRGEYYYDDDYLFSVDLNGGAEYQREALWQRNLDNLKAGTLGDPSSSITLLRYWQCQERAHYPHARENVEYFLSALEEERRGRVEL